MFCGWGGGAVGGGGVEVGAGEGREREGEGGGWGETGEERSDKENVRSVATSRWVLLLKKGCILFLSSLRSSFLPSLQPMIQPWLS